MKRIAIPVFEDRISNRLDCSENLLLVSLEKGEIIKREIVLLTHTGSSAKLNTLIGLKIDVLICNGITTFYSRRLSNTNIEIIPWVSGKIDEVLAWYLESESIPKNSYDGNIT